MWTVGMKVKCIGFRYDTDEDHVTIGNVYTIIELHNGHPHNTDDHQFRIINDQHQEWWVYGECFKVFDDRPKTRPKSESEWLDRIQQNFRE